MNTTAIYIKTEARTKEKAQRVAKELGLSLSVVINALLKQFIKTKSVTFSANDEIPNERTLAIMKQAEENYKKGNTSPAFKTGREAVAWLEKQGI
ncbi:MAG: type II toxin-antitoxin system RelB/DinJ family antitoxin [Patescibacteria group bacterium]